MYKGLFHNNINITEKGQTSTRDYILVPCPCRRWLLLPLCALRRHRFKATAHSGVSHQWEDRTGEPGNASLRQPHARLHS